MNPVGLNPKKFKKQAKIQKMQNYIVQLEATVGYLKGKVDEYESKQATKGSDMPALFDNDEINRLTDEEPFGGMLKGKGEVGEIGESSTEVSQEVVMAKLEGMEGD